MLKITVMMAIVLAVSEPAVARNAQYLTTTWIILPVTVAEQPTVVKPREYVLRQRLVPSGLIKLSAPLTIDDETLPIGYELFEVRSGERRIYCDPNLKASGTLRGLLIGGTHGPKAICFVDSFSRGAIDGFFRAESQTTSIPFVSGRLPNQPRPVEPTAYEHVDPQTFHGDTFVAIEYQGKPLLYNRRNFAVTFGNGTAHETLGAFIHTGSTFPSNQVLLGAQFTVISEKDGAVSVRVNQTMPSQPFSVHTEYKTTLIYVPR